MNSIDTRGSTTVATTTDGQLFALMAERGEAAKEAWAEFYLRYVDHLRKLVCRIRGLPQAGINDLVQETMIQAYKAAHTFRDADMLDTETSRRRALAWLCRIARNLHWSMLRQQKSALVDNLAHQEGSDDSQLSVKGRRLFPGEVYRKIQEAENKVAGEDDGNDDQISLHRSLLRDALDALTERERDILIATYEHYERGQKQQRLPKAVVDKICETHNISPANLRQIRKRALEKIEQYVDAHMPAES